MYVVGVGLRRGTGEADLDALVAAVLAEAGIGHERVTALATLEGKEAETAVTATCERYGWELRIFRADTLAAVPVPAPEIRVARAVGTPSVAEAAALAGAGVRAELIVGKRRSARATAALARVTALEEAPG
ncbi:cobalamin biosynthesis protein [Actinocorallia longicatena]|uniref:CobE/GbiG C-terminal domain-containing protein n=1 Tax=Actinocorallia longicatena TaxID=111803 RepID=A0ABP6QGT7_9ACTN